MVFTFSSGLLAKRPENTWGPVKNHSQQVVKIVQFEKSPSGTGHLWSLGVSQHYNASDNNPVKVCAQLVVKVLRE